MDHKGGATIPKGFDSSQPCDGRTLKKSASSVLASFRSSTRTRPPHRLGGAHRRGAPYSSHRAPQRVRFGSSLAAALLDGLFEHPAGVFSSCAARVDHRIVIVQEVYFR